MLTKKQQQNLLSSHELQTDYWKQKYLKEHQRKKKLNKTKKETIKSLKKRTKQTKNLDKIVNKMKATAFLKEHDYF